MNGHLFGSKGARSKPKKSREERRERKDGRRPAASASTPKPAAAPYPDDPDSPTTGQRGRAPTRPVNIDGHSESVDSPCKRERAPARLKHVHRPSQQEERHQGRARPTGPGRASSMTNPYHLEDSGDSLKRGRGSPAKQSNKAKSGGLSLEAGLAKVAAPSLERQDFGRDADDADTFIGTGTVDGEVSSGKLHLKHSKTKDPFAMNSRSSGSSPFGGGNRTTFGGPSPFGGNSNPFGARDDDSESEDEEEEDLFADMNNPYRPKNTFI